MEKALSRNRRKAQKGNALIEATAIMLLMFGLIFLVIDLSLALFTKATLQTAVRAGVRFAVTDQLASGTSYMNDSIVQVVQQNSLGMLSGSSGACKIVVSYVNPYTGAASTGNPGDIVSVAVVGYKYTPVGILKSATALSIGASSSDVLEACPVSGCPPVINPAPASCN